jgi:hypothetical protein
MGGDKARIGGTGERSVTGRIAITVDNGEDYFTLERLDADSPAAAFGCRIGEYAGYLREDALRSQADYVAQTWVLLERESAKIAAYMSLIADAVRLSNAEKELPYCAARFLTVDADIEHDTGVLAFYEKLRFEPNAELSGKRRKTVSMRLDLYS